MKIGEQYTTKERGILVTKLTETIWRTDPKFMPGRGTVVIVDPRPKLDDDPNREPTLLGPKWAVEAVAEAEKQ